jgi:3D (Asp-Asp-Asp) domain-containing protein
MIIGAPRRGAKRAALQILAGLGLVAATAGSAIFVKEFSASVHPLAAVELLSTSENTAAQNPPAEVPGAILAMPESEPVIDASEVGPPAPAPEIEKPSIDPKLAKYAADPNIRWFNGRPIRPARTMSMLVTGYSPDEKSCGESADGITATLHSVETNGMKLVAADTRILPFGSLVSIPGYDTGNVVPVLDRGGAIKGRHLDALFPTDAQARKWGKQKLTVTVWEYADGKPMDNPRKLR